MPSYREVSQLPLRQLIQYPEDNVHTVDADMSISDAGVQIRSIPIRAVAVIDRDGKALGVIEERYILDAIGTDLSMPCTQVMRTDQITRETMTLEGLRGFVGPFRTILVVDESGKPIAHIHRDALAERITNLA